MKVSELIEKLQLCDPDADVLIPDIDYITHDIDLKDPIFWTDLSALVTKFTRVHRVSDEAGNYDARWHLVNGIHLTTEREADEI